MTTTAASSTETALWGEIDEALADWIDEGIVERSPWLSEWGCSPLICTPLPYRVPGVWFDRVAVERVLRFFAMLRQLIGRHAGAPFVLQDWQVRYLVAPVFGMKHPDGRRVIRTFWFEIPRKNGKGLYTGTMILTRNGWKQFGDLEPGDEVHSVDGTLTKVTWVSPTRNLDCYQVTFADGQSFVCDEDHLWTVWDRYGHDPEAWAESRQKGAWRTIATPELAETHRAGKRGDTRYSVQTDRVLERPSQDLPIDPYLLGLWLGDGHTDAARVTTVDPTIWQAFADRGYAVHRVPGTVTYAVNDGFKVALRDLGVLGNKHVPEPYLLGSEEQRLALLQGLMDTDGGVNRGPNTPRVEFVSTKKALADGVYFLARSLGWKATIREYRTKLDGKDCGPGWKVNWTAFSGRSPFRLERKTKRLHTDSGNATRSTTNTITSVERVPSVPTRCIAVEHESKQFLVGEGLTPTHNSTLCSGLALYLFAADREPGAEVYAAAGDREQANIVFRAAANMAKGCKPLAKKLGRRGIQRKLLENPDTNSIFRALSSEGLRSHGLNVHGGIIDEVHVHKNPDVIDALETGTGARDQPLIGFITTADDGSDGVYNTKREDVETLAGGHAVDATMWGVVFGVDDAAADFDPYSDETLKAANPGYGVTVMADYLRAKADEAARSNQQVNRYLRLHLNVRTKQVTRWIPLEVWDQGGGLIDVDALQGRECYAGLDLSSTSDLTALVLWFPPDDPDEGTHTLLPFFWLPEDNLRDVQRQVKVPLDRWSKTAGPIGPLLRLTEGNVVDYRAIRQFALDELATRFNIQALGYDRWNATETVLELRDAGVHVEPVGQGYAGMSPPAKELERLLLAGRVHHGGHPLLRWMADCVEIRADDSENIKPVKPNRATSAKRIDGFPAALNALSQHLLRTTPEAPAPEPRIRVIGA